MIAKVCAQTSKEKHEKAAEWSEAAVIQHMHNIDDLWQELFPTEQQRITQLLVEGAYLNIDGVEVRMRAEGLASLVAEIEDDEQNDTADQESEQCRLLRLKQEQVLKKVA